MSTIKRYLLKWLMTILNDKQKRILCLTTLYLKLSEHDKTLSQTQIQYLYRRANILLNLVRTEDGAMVFASKFTRHIWPDAIKEIPGDSNRIIHYLVHAVPFWLKYAPRDQIHNDIIRIVRDIHSQPVL